MFVALLLGAVILSVRVLIQWRRRRAVFRIEPPSHLA
jgi:hypothetical protein